jgi:hypothetical protein
MLLALCPACRALVKSIFCDSQAKFCFEVSVGHWDDDLALHIGPGLDT